MSEAGLEAAQEELQLKKLSPHSFRVETITRMEEHIKARLRKSGGIRDLVRALRADLSSSRYLCCPLITTPETEVMLNSGESGSLDWRVILFVCKQNPNGVYLFSDNLDGAFSSSAQGVIIGDRETLFMGTHPEGVQYKNRLQMKEVRYLKLDWESGEISS